MDNYCDGCNSREHETTAITVKGEQLDACDTCKPRLLEGLIPYTPSNGTEGRMFFDRCESCAHNLETDPDYPIPPSFDGAICRFAIRDKLVMQMWEDQRHPSRWHHPDHILTYGPNGEIYCPAVCLKWHDKDDPHFRAPIPDVPGQMMLIDMDVPTERVKEAQHA